MFPFAKIFFLVFGLFTIVGGVIGYVKANSNASLIAGLAFGLLLAVGGWLLRPGGTLILVGLAFVCGALLYRFGPAYYNTGSLMPAGLMAALALVGLILAVAAIFVRPAN